MKKIVVLLMAVVFLGAGCLLFRDPRVQTEMQLEQIAQSYKITRDVSVSIVGQDRDVKVAEKVFNDFGFSVIGDSKEFLFDPEFKIKIERNDLGGGGNSNYGFGSSYNQKYVIRARLEILNHGVKKIIEDTTSYTYRSTYSGGYASRHNYQNDPGEVAFRASLMVCVGKFIDAAGIPYTKK